MTPLRVGTRSIGDGEPCFVIAEAGVNHNGDAVIARQLIDVAHAAGADAVKFQTFDPASLVTTSSPKVGYQLRTTSGSESQFEMLQRLALDRDVWSDLKRYADELGIEFLSTPFDEGSCDLLAEVGIRAFKIASSEITNLPLISHVARYGKPVLLSTGMSTIGEIEGAMDAIAKSGSPPVMLLHCVSDYPADPKEANLRAMATLRSVFGCPVGYSDHTPGIDVSLAATALGARAVEKHVTLSRSLSGPDQAASIEPAELTSLVRGIRIIEAALGDGHKGPTPRELETARALRRSLVCRDDIKAGALITDQMVVARRPGTGLPPSMRSYVVGRRARIDLRAETIITFDNIE